MEQKPNLIKCLQRGELFAGLSDTVLEKVAAISQQETYSAKATIFSEGDPANKVYLLQSGVVVIRIQPVPEAKSIVVEPIKDECAVFGWSGLAEPNVYTATAICATDAQIISVDGDKLMALLEEFPSDGLVVMRRLAAIISSRLRRTREHLTRDVHLVSYRF